MMVRLAPFFALAVLLAACGGGGDGEFATVSTLTPPPPTVSLAKDGCDLDEALPPVIAACEDLVARFERAPGEVLAVIPRQWPSSCLGAPEPGEICTEAVVAGYEVTFRIERTRYTYHTDEDTNVRFASFDILRTGEERGAQLVVRGHEPVAFDFTSDGRLLFTLRQEGEVRWVDINAWDPSAPADEGALFAEVAVFRGSECGLLGIAVDPEFSTNHYVYVYATQPVSGRRGVGKPRVIRYTDVDGRGTGPTVIVDDLPLSNPLTCAHVGGNLHFGPDGYLYLSLGNNERMGIAEDLSSPLGKILRMDKSDGSAAPDNPFVDDPAADPRIFAYGLRNPWDFAFHPETGKIYAPDNGSGSCDELNLVEAGMDYGMPHSPAPAGSPACLGRGGVDPIYLFALPDKQPQEFSSNVAPAGVAFLPKGVYPGLGGGLLVCEFLTRSLRYLEFEGPDQDKVRRDLVLIDTCRFNVGIDYEGVIYYSDDDAIYRLPPEALPEPD